MVFNISLENRDKSGIYIITNSVNSKVYVGSSVLLKNRFRQHIGSLAKGTHHASRLQNFVNKYGIDALSFSLLEVCEKDDLLTCEQKWIVFYNAANRACGFNHLPTAGSRLGCKASVETIEKLRGRKYSEESKAKMSESRKGKPSNMTPEGRAAFSNKMRNRVFSVDHKNKIKKSKQGAGNATAKITDSDALTIRALYHKHTYKEIAEIFPISKLNVRNIVKGYTWQHLPLEDYSERPIRVKGQPAQSCQKH